MGIYSNLGFYSSIEDELFECPFNHQCSDCEYDCTEDYQGECIIDG